MKRILALILILPALALAQARFGHGAMSPSQMLPVITDAIADSSRWTAGTHVHAIKPRGGKSVQADSAKLGYLNVTGDTQLDGNLTMNTVASESLKVLAGGIRNEGGFRQKGLSQFGATGTPVYITTDGKLGIGTSTSSPYNAFGMVSPTSGRGTGIGLTSAQWNINRTSWTTASDTSAIGLYIDSAGGPRWFMRAVDGDTVGVWHDGTYFYIKSLTDISLWPKTSTNTKGFIWDATKFYWADDSKSVGGTGVRFQNYYGSDNIYLGGKSQTATMYVSGENTIAGSDSSWTMSASSGVPTLEAKFALPAASYSNGGRRTYFGPDTLALFNGARTGRDSTWATLANGNVLNNGIVTIKRAVSLTDAGEYTPQIPSGMCGWGMVDIGNHQEWARFFFQTDGTVTLEANSTNVGTTNDTDTKLNIYDAGTSGIVIENQLGSTLTAAMVIECYTP